MMSHYLKLATQKVHPYKPTWVWDSAPLDAVDQLNLELRTVEGRGRLDEEFKLWLAFSSDSHAYRILFIVCHDYD